MGESSFWYRPTRVVPDQRPLNGRCCCYRQNEVCVQRASHHKASEQAQLDNVADASKYRELNVGSPAERPSLRQVTTTELVVH